ncbi:MAG: HDOD domain-containing protein [Kofleriaceae bacterium]
MVEKLVAEIERLVLARVATGKIDVPPIDLVAMRCLEVLRDRDFDHRKLVKQIEKEPMIAALVMRTANAALYGQGVARLEQAVLRLGALRLEAVILEYAAKNLFDNRGPFADANRKIWEHSVAVARIARGLASCVGKREPDQYYLAGLFHDIGKPVVAALLIETAKKVAPGIKSWLDVPLWDRVIRDCHPKAAVMVGVAWKLPPALMVNPVADWDAADRHSISNLVRMANAMAKKAGFVTGPVDDVELDVMISAGTTLVGIDPKILEGVIGLATETQS